MHCVYVNMALTVANIVHRDTFIELGLDLAFGNCAVKGRKKHKYWKLERIGTLLPHHSHKM